MKKIILIIFLLGFGFTINSFAEEEVLVSGVWMKGADLTEPRPVKSEYFKVYQGGFYTSVKGARYFLLADILPNIEKPLWVKVQCQNPLNPKEPFIEEGPINVGDRSLHYSSDYIKGLKIYREYWMKITLYDSKEQKKEIDKITQKIRSYVDTTGEEVRIYKDVKEKTAK